MLLFSFYLVLEHYCSCVTGSFGAFICAKNWVMVESLSIWAHFGQSWFWTQSRPLELAPPSSRSGHTGNGKDPAKLHLGCWTRAPATSMCSCLCCASFACSLRSLYCVLADLGYRNRSWPDWCLWEPKSNRLEFRTNYYYFGPFWSKVPNRFGRAQSHCSLSCITATHYPDHLNIYSSVASNGRSFAL